MIFKTFLLLTTFFTALRASGLACRAFEIYPDISAPHVTPALQNDSLSASQLIQRISGLKGHTQFKKQFHLKTLGWSEQKALSTLQCLYAQLHIDMDGDGIKDWRISTENQIFDLLLPLDADWDNDGVTNIFDAHPWKASGKPDLKSLPAHLWLHAEKEHPLNQKQFELFSQCDFLALNHTDRHHLDVLDSLLKLCRNFIPKRSNSSPLLTVYAFAGHTVTNSSLAMFFPELNFMSLRGQSTPPAALSSEKLSDLIAHELGHFYLFNFLSVLEVATLANTYGDWQIPTSPPPESVFDDFFMKRATGSNGYFPTSYSKKNVHEWFSELISIYVLEEIGRKNLRSFSRTQFSAWLEKRK